MHRNFPPNELWHSSKRIWLIIIYATFFINRFHFECILLHYLCRNHLVPEYINGITSCLFAFTMSNRKIIEYVERASERENHEKSVHVKRAKLMEHSEDVTWFDWNRFLIPSHSSFCSLRFEQYFFARLSAKVRITQSSSFLDWIHQFPRSLAHSILYPYNNIYFTPFVFSPHSDKVT